MVSNVNALNVKEINDSPDDTDHTADYDDNNGCGEVEDSLTGVI